MAKQAKAKALPDEGNYYSTRLNFRDPDDLKRYKLLQDILVILGKDELEFWNGYIRHSLNYYKAHRAEDFDSALVVIDAEKFRAEILLYFSVKLSRFDLKRLREKYWTEGVEYFAAPSGSKQVFRYDLEKCLAGVKKFLGKE